MGLPSYQVSAVQYPVMTAKGLHAPSPSAFLLYRSIRGPPVTRNRVISRLKLPTAKVSMAFNAAQVFHFGVGLAGSARDAVSVESAPVGLIDAVEGFLLTERLRMREERDVSISAEGAAQLAAAMAEAAAARAEEPSRSASASADGPVVEAGLRALNFQRKATPQDHAAEIEGFGGIAGAGLATLESLGLLTDAKSQARSSNVRQSANPLS